MARHEHSRRVAVITVGRSDFGILKPVLAAMEQSKSLRPELWVSGAHLSKTHGQTIQEIEADGVAVARRIPVRMPEADAAADADAEVSQTMAETLSGFGAAFADSRPDIIFALGDRFEMFAAVSASVPFNIPVAHLHGGEVSYGAIDEVFRHAITKIAHVHFAATPTYANRILAMGEEPWRVHWTGAPGLDVAMNQTLPARTDLEARFGLDLREPPVLVTFHAETRDSGNADKQINELLSALESLGRPIVFTAPNADPGGLTIRRALDTFTSRHQRTWLVENFGSENYLAMLRESCLVIGNSSSGLIETPVFKRPALNVGNRQDGRIAGTNVVHCACEREAIRSAAAHALSREFRDGLSNMRNPYGDGQASKRIVGVLEALKLEPALLAKRFHDVNWIGPERFDAETSER